MAIQTENVTARPCPDCGTDISHMNRQAHRCAECADARRAEFNRNWVREHRTKGLYGRGQNESTIRCWCCKQKFRPTKERTRLCRPCYADTGGINEHHCHMMA